MTGRARLRAQLLPVHRQVSGCRRASAAAVRRSRPRRTWFARERLATSVPAVVAGAALAAGPTSSPGLLLAGVSAALGVGLVRGATLRSVPTRRDRQGDG